MSFYGSQKSVIASYVVEVQIFKTFFSCLHQEAYTEILLDFIIAKVFITWVFVETIFKL